MLTKRQLLAIAPNAPTPALWVSVLNPAIARFEIDTSARVAAFLAQIAHESDEFHHLVENLSYSAPRLMQVWPRRFPTLASARRYERSPARLANVVYGNRLGNRPPSSGDGWRYRGRGLIQLTGRGNYRTAALALDLPLEDHPELVETPEVAALTAAQFWYSRGLNALADDRRNDDDDEDFVRISIAINGGRQGLASRRRYWARARAVLWQK